MKSAAIDAAKPDPDHPVTRIPVPPDGTSRTLARASTPGTARTIFMSIAPRHTHCRCP